MRQFLLGLCVSAVFIAGCVAGASDLVVPKAQAARTPDQRWAYLCVDARTADDAHSKANAAGNQGWELTAASPGEGGQVIWCFKQPQH